MEYTRMGNSGLKISKVVLGGMSYGTPKWQGWVLPEEKVLPLLKHAYDVGINTWDTADTYSDGRSEEIIGKALKTYDIDRSTVVILTKCFFAVDDPNKGRSSNELSADVASNPAKWNNRKGLSRKHIFDAVDASVKRLGTYIDVLQIHRLDRETPPEEIMKALNDVIESGKVRYIGASTMYAWEFQMLQNIADRRGWHKFISMQNYVNLLYREEEREMIPYCNYTNVHLLPWSPIARGRLARPYDSEKSNPNVTHREANDPWTAYLNMKGDGEKAVTDRVEELAKKKGVSMAIVAIVWCLTKKNMSPILGLGSKERIDEAVEAVKWAGKGLLTAEDCKYLEECYQPKAPDGGLEV